MDGAHEQVARTAPAGDPDPPRAPEDYTFTPMRWRDARQIASWRYESVYAFYDPSAVPLLTLAALRALWRMLGIEAFVAWTPDDPRPAGIFTFIHRGPEVEVGLAMRPDLTGRGLGLGFFQAGVELARRRYAPDHLVLDVATFNERARKVYARAGFVPNGTVTRRSGGRPIAFLKMKRDV